MKEVMKMEREYKKIMDIKELKQFISDLQIDACYENLIIKGMNINESNAILQELAREKGLQFEIEFSGGSWLYTIKKPSKKFLNKEGRWSMPISKKAKEFIHEFKNA